MGCAFVFLALLPARAANWSVHVQPARIVNGAPLLFQVKSPEKVDSLSGTWLGHHLTFIYNTATRNWNAFAGVSIETAPGSYPLELIAARNSSARPLTLSRKVSISRAKYPRIKVALAVDEKFTEPTPEQLKQIEEAKTIKEDYLNRVTPDREWSGKFTAPTAGSISDVFGSERIFNGKTSSPHLGLDFRVPSGTPVAAMNDGTVLLARTLYFEGNFVVLDHGQGLLTLYLHLSEFKVKEGEVVKRGQIVGLSGGTGRATGPHLHVAVRWQGTYLDPVRMMQLPLPTGSVQNSSQTSRLAPQSSLSFAQSFAQDVFQRQVPNQTVQVIRMHSENLCRFDVIASGLPNRIQN
jgi:murein DD-endopeptidase MepM/ murein hydrolase activator NlpD